MSGSANRRWREALAEWAIPDAILAAVPVSPYVFDASVFAGAADDAIARTDDTPSDVAARDALPAGGTVLDVGVGAGAASLRLGAAHVIGVDASEEMLRAFAARATGLGVEHTEIEGRWPDVAPMVPVADVAVCHHVFFNVADLASFATDLSAHARRRVVVELTSAHPMSWLNEYWRALHGLARPSRPTADDALDVLRELDLDVHRRDWRRPIQMIGEDDADAVARLARRLCLPPDRHGEVAALLATSPPPRERDVVTLWWDTATA